MKPNPALTASLAALREPLPVVNDWTGRPQSLDWFSIVVQAEALDRWREKCGQLQAQVDRLQRELAAANERVDRLRDACGHIKGFAEWGMNDAK